MSEIRKKLKMIDKQVQECTKCTLCSSRRNTILNEHCPTARLMIVAEPQGGFDRHSGFPLTGKGGKMFSRMIQRIGVRREDLFIESITKCNLPRVRAATARELEACLPYLCQQIHLVQPHVILAMGSVATETLLGNRDAMSRIHGRVFRLKDYEEKEIWVVPTYHPDVILRAPQKKDDAWDDLGVVRRQLRKAAEASLA